MATDADLAEEFNSLDRDLREALLHQVAALQDCGRMERGQLSQMFDGLNAVPDLAEWPDVLKFLQATTAVVRHVP